MATADCSSRASSSMTATPLAASLAARIGLRQFSESGSLSAQGRESQWAQSMTRVVAAGLWLAMMLVLFSRVPS